jgi:replicative DNA helicase
MKSFNKQLTSEIRRQQLQKVSRAKELVKLLERLVKQEHLYTVEKIIEMKEQLRSIKEQMSEIEAQTSKGFGKK